MAIKKITAINDHFGSGILKYFGFKGSTMSGIRSYVRDTTREAILITREEEPEQLNKVAKFLEAKGYAVTHFLIKNE